MSNNDLISRVAAIEYFMTNMVWHDEDGYEVDDADEKRAIITDFFNGIPAVDAVPIVHAEWVKENDRVNHWHCSNCDNAFGQVVYFYKFCPFCGASMTVKDQTNL